MKRWIGRMVVSYPKDMSEGDKVKADSCLMEGSMDNKSQILRKKD